MTKWQRAVRRAVATFVFATGGSLIGNSIFGVSAASWKVIAGVGIGALVNLAYRWGEAVVAETPPVDIPATPKV